MLSPKVPFYNSNVQCKSYFEALGKCLLLLWIIWAGTCTHIQCTYIHTYNHVNTYISVLRACVCVCVCVCVRVCVGVGVGV